MPLIRVKSNIIVNGAIVEPGTYPKEELGNADINYLVSKGIVEIAGDRPWDVLLPDSPTDENYVEEIERMQAALESLHGENEQLRRELKAKNTELQKAADTRPLNRFHAPEAGELQEAREEANHWRVTAEQQAKEMQSLRHRNDRYAEQLGTPNVGIDDAAGEPRTDGITVNPVPGTQLPVVESDVITTTGGGNQIRATTRRIPPTRQK